MSRASRPVATTPLVLPPAYFGSAVTATSGASASTSDAADAEADADAEMEGAGGTDAAAEGSVLGTVDGAADAEVTGAVGTANAAGPMIASTTKRMVTLTPRQAKKAFFARAIGSKHRPGYRTEDSL